MKEDSLYRKQAPQPLKIWEKITIFFIVVSALIALTNLIQFVSKQIDSNSFRRAITSSAAVAIINIPLLLLENKRKGRLIIGLLSLLLCISGIASSIYLYTSAPFLENGAQTAIVIATFLLVVSLFYAYSFILFIFTKKIISLFRKEKNEREVELVNNKDQNNNNNNNKRTSKKRDIKSIIIFFALFINFFLCIQLMIKEYTPTKATHEPGSWRQYYLFVDSNYTKYNTGKVELDEANFLKFRYLDKFYATFESCKKDYGGLIKGTFGFEEKRYNTSYTIGGCARDCYFSPDTNDLNLSTCEEVVELYDKKYWSSQE